MKEQNIQEFLDQLFTSLKVIDSVLHKGNAESDVWVSLSKKELTKLVLGDIHPDTIGYYQLKRTGE